LTSVGGGGCSEEEEEEAGAAAAAKERLPRAEEAGALLGGWMHLRRRVPAVDLSMVDEYIKICRVMVCC